MTPFELLEPGSLAEAIKLLDPEDSDIRPIAGGTALMLMMKAGVFRPRCLVSLRKLPPELSRISAGSGGSSPSAQCVRFPGSSGRLTSLGSPR